MSTLTPTQQVEIYAWWKAKKSLGSFKTKARELGVAKGLVESVVRRMSARERKNMDPTVKPRTGRPPKKRGPVDFLENVPF